MLEELKVFEAELKNLKKDFHNVALRAFEHADHRDCHAYYALQLTELAGLIKHYEELIRIEKGI